VWVQPKEYKIVGTALASVRGGAGADTEAIGPAPPKATVLRIELRAGAEAAGCTGIIADC
jgi:hypothetical protein